MTPRDALRCAGCAERHRGHARGTRDRHRAAGLCLRCAAPAAEGARLCDAHLAGERSRCKLRAGDLEAAGRCVRCGRKRRVAGTRCGRCAKRDNRRQRARRAARHG